MRNRLRLAAMSLWIAAGVAVFAQRPGDVVRWSVKQDVLRVKPGQTVTFELTGDVAPGWKLYALTQPKGGPLPLTLTVGKGKPFEIRATGVTAPVPAVHQDPNFDLPTRQYQGKVVLGVPLVAKPGASAGRHVVPVDVTFQSCSETICLRPFTQTVQLQVAVGGQSP
jgi:hypothetical protein